MFTFHLFRTIILLIAGLDNAGKSLILNHISGGKYLEKIKRKKKLGIDLMT
jgi:GTPase SAR1 family protein